MFNRLIAWSLNNRLTTFLGYRLRRDISHDRHIVITNGG